MVQLLVRLTSSAGEIGHLIEALDVGIDLGTPVVESIGAEAASRFSGRIPKLTIEVKASTSPSPVR